MLGLTGSGKSTVMRSLFLSMAAPRLVVDPQGSTLTAVPGAVTFSDPSRMPDAATARFVPADPLDLDAYDTLYDRARARVVDAIRRGDRARARLWIWCDEAGMVMPSSRSPRAAEAVVIAGRKLQIGHGATHVRARQMSPSLLAQAHHLACFPVGLAADREYIADNIGVDRQVLAAALDSLTSEHSCVWWQQRTRTLTPVTFEAA